jgi:hypothetical protein
MFSRFQQLISDDRQGELGGLRFRKLGSRPLVDGVRNLSVLELGDGFRLGERCALPIGI